MHHHPHPRQTTSAGPPSFASVRPRTNLKSSAGVAALWNRPSSFSDPPPSFASSNRPAQPPITAAFAVSDSQKPPAPAPPDDLVATTRPKSLNGAFSDPGSSPVPHQLPAPNPALIPASGDRSVTVTHPAIMRRNDHPQTCGTTASEVCAGGHNHLSSSPTVEGSAFQMERNTKNSPQKQISTTSNTRP